MKKIIVILFLSVLLFGCIDNRTDEQKRTDRIVEYRKKEAAIKHKENWKGFSVIVVDSCEYITKTVHTRPNSNRATAEGYLAHKGNCRFCTERRKQESRSNVVKYQNY